MLRSRVWVLVIAFLILVFDRHWIGDRSLLGMDPATRVAALVFGGLVVLLSSRVILSWRAVQRRRVGPAHGRAAIDRPAATTIASPTHPAARPMRVLGVRVSVGIGLTFLAMAGIGAVLGDIIGPDTVAVSSGLSLGILVTFYALRTPMEWPVSPWSLVRVALMVGAAALVAAALADLLGLYASWSVPPSLVARTFRTIAIGVLPFVVLVVRVAKAAVRSARR